MCNSVVNVFSKQARFRDLGPIPSNTADLYGWPITKEFRSIVNFHVGNLRPILWSTFSRNRRGFRTWDQFHRIQGPVRVANHKGFFYIVNFHAGNLCPILWSTFSRNRRGFRTWDQFHRIEETCRVINHT